MSSILKGLNESNSVYGHSDPDREYGAPATSYGKRGPYYQTDDDDDGNPFAEYERQQRMFAQGRAQKAAKEKAQRDADHDRLATGTNEEQLDELSNEKLGQYKTAAAADAGKADIAGDYKKADKRFSGIVKATKKQFANDTKTVKEADGQKEYILYINNKPAAKYVDQLQAERDMASVKKKHPQVRIELKHEVCDLETIKKINENQLMGNALLEAKSLLTQLDESTQQQVINTLKKNVDDEKGAFKTGYPRLNNPKILGTNNKAKSIYYPPSKPNVKKLDKPLPESLGDQLKSKSIEALQQVKQKLEQQRMADLEQWEKDFKQNTVAKFTARQPSFMQQQPKQVAKPLEKHSVLKARLAQLDKAIEKQAILDKMLQRLDAKGLLTPAIQSDTDTSMLVRDGANDNYVSLNQKLDKALEFVKNRLLTNKAAFAKPKAIDEAGTGLDIDRSIPGRTIARVSDKENSVSSKAKTLPSYADREDEYDRWSGKTSASTHDDEEDTFDIDYTGDEDGELDENLHKWFKEKWVRFGPDGKIRGDCARGDDSEGKPKCLPQSKAHSLGKKGRASAASRKRREDPNPERSGKAINVNTKKKSNESVVIGRDEGNFAGDTPVNLGSVSVKNLVIGDIVSYLGQKAKILAMSKTGNTSRIHIPSSMGGVTKDVLTKDLKRTSLSEEELDEACWKGYHKEGNKKMFGKTYPNCVKNTNEEQELNEFATDGFNGGDDGEEFNPNLAKMAQEDGFTKGAGLADGATLERAMAINDWDKHDGGIYSQHFAKGFIAGRKDKIRHNNKQYNLNLQLMKDGSIRHGEQELDEYGDTAKGQKMLAKVHHRAADRVTSKKADTDPKYAKKNQDTANAAYDRMKDVAEGVEDAGVQDAIIDTVERLFHKNNLSDYGALEAIRQGVKHHFSKSGATAESAIQGILNILDKRMSKSGSYLDLSRFKEALRQGIAHRLKKQGVAEEHHSESCPHCGGEMVSEELMNEKKDACYYKVKSRYKVWPSAYASGALVKCRKKGASNWGTGGKSNESIEEDDAGDVEQRMIAKIEKEKQRLAKLKQTDPEAYKREMTKSKTSSRVPPVSTFEARGVAEDQLDEKWTKKYKDSINCSNPKGFSQKAHCAGKQKNESAILKGLK